MSSQNKFFDLAYDASFIGIILYAISALLMPTIILLAIIFGSTEMACREKFDHHRTADQNIFERVVYKNAEICKNYR